MNDIEKAYEDHKKKLIEFIKESDKNSENTISELDELLKSENNNNFYSKSLELFIHLSFNEDEAKMHWNNIFENYKFLKNSLNRNIGLKVSIFDYFINYNDFLLNPMLIEIHMFKASEKLAMIDSLTGLFNRKYLNITLKKEINRAARFKSCISILLIDLDNFKNINDTMGHVFGDKVLVETAALITKSSREEDTVVRYGGEEFLIILPETSAIGALKYGERIRQILKKHPFFKKNKITFSGGIATFPNDTQKMEVLIDIADKALYAAKYSGKDRIIKNKGERRKYKRYLHSHNILYQPIDKVFNDKSNEKTFTTQDLSLGGLRFESDEEYKIGTKLLLNLTMQDKSLVNVIGKIVWLKIKNDKQFIYGIKFFDLNDEQIDKIRKNLEVKEQDNLN